MNDYKENWKNSEWFAKWIDMAKHGVDWKKPEGYWVWISNEKNWKYCKE
jgi:hypothetical protein